MKNMTISKKLFLSFGTIILFTAVIIFISILSLSSVGKKIDQMYSGPLMATNAAMGARRDLNSLGKNIRSAIIAKDLEAYKDEMANDSKSFQERINILRNNFTGDQTLVDTLNDKVNILIQEKETVIKFIEQKDYDSASEVTLSSFYAAFKEATEAANIIYNAAMTNANNFLKQADSMKQLTIIFLFVMLAISIIVAVIITRITIKSIIPPILELKEASNSLQK